MPQPEGAHEDDAEASLLPDEVPKSEMLFLHCLLWHLGHSTSTVAVIERTSLSNLLPHASHRYS
jgi:hypothetical protein